MKRAKDVKKLIINIPDKKIFFTPLLRLVAFILAGEDLNGKQ